MSDAAMGGELVPRSPAVPEGMVVVPADMVQRLEAALAALEQQGTKGAAAVLPDHPDHARDPRAAKYHKKARSEETRRAYRQGISYFLDFTSSTGRREVPATASTAEAFAVWLMHKPITRGRNKGRVGMAPATIRLYLSAVCTFHRVQGENPPDLGLAGDAIEGYERERAEDPTCTDGQGVPGLRLPSLRQMFEVCDPATNQGARDRALLSLGWAMMARRSELSALDIGHVILDEDGVIVFVRKSKTDQKAKGKKIRIPWKTELGQLCPVVNITRWHERLAEHGITEGGFLRGVDRHGRINGQAGWAGVVSARMDPGTVEDVIARVAIEARVRDAGKLRGHSLRRGGASDMYDAGADILSIARQGRWNERSPVIFKYIEEDVNDRRNPLRVAKFEAEG